MFNFRLQAILDVRKLLEEKVLTDFSEHQKSLKKEQESLQVIQQQKEVLMETLRDIQGKSVNVSEITFNALSMKQCLRDADIQEGRVREATNKVDKKREELLEASKKRKAMEILKENIFEKYQSDINLLDRTNTDEMAIVRHKRRDAE